MAIDTGCSTGILGEDDANVVFPCGTVKTMMSRGIWCCYVALSLLSFVCQGDLYVVGVGWLYSHAALKI